MNDDVTDAGDAKETMERSTVVKPSYLLPIGNGVGQSDPWPLATFRDSSPFAGIGLRNNATHPKMVELPEIRPRITDFRGPVTPRMPIARWCQTRGETVFHQGLGRLGINLFPPHTKPRRVGRQNCSPPRERRDPMPAPLPAPWGRHKARIGPPGDGNPPQARIVPPLRGLMACGAQFPRLTPRATILSPQTTGLAGGVDGTVPPQIPVVRQRQKWLKSTDT